MLYIYVTLQKSSPIALMVNSKKLSSMCQFQGGHSVAPNLQV